MNGTSDGPRFCRLQRRRHDCGRAFTLIEIMAVVLLIGLISAGVMWSFSAPLAKSALIQTVEQLRYIDASARRLARQGGRPVQVVIDLDEGRLTRRVRGSGAGSDVGTYEVAVRAPLKIRRVRTGDRDQDSGAIVIDYSPLGFSRSYAIQIAAGSGGDQEQQQRWITVAGLSGECSVMPDEGQARKIFARAIAPAQ